MISGMKVEGTGSFGNSLFLIFMILGGAMVIPAGQTLFARLFGSGEDMHGGGGFLRSAFYGGRIASAVSLHALTGLFRGSVRTGKKIVSRGNRHSGSASNGDGQTKGETEKYTEEAPKERNGGGKA